MMNDDDLIIEEYKHSIVGSRPGIKVTHEPTGKTARVNASDNQKLNEWDARKKLWFRLIDEGEL